MKINERTKDRIKCLLIAINEDTYDLIGNSDTEHEKTDNQLINESLSSLKDLSKIFNILLINSIDNEK